jgi:hypothetical protein
MAINIPIISEFDGTGIKKALAQFKQLETTSEKANFAIKKAAMPAGIAVAALGGFLVNAAKGAEEARQANQRLGNVLESMGFGEATDRVSAYAESLEKTIAVDADVIKATQTKLATFGQLTKTVNEAGGAFDRATLAALDMAAAGFGSAESNAVALGKALEDPIKGITALAKSGVTFTEQEKEKIKTLVESNNLLEAQDMVLKAIEKQVGGTSEASASSFDKMKFALAGISDTFGELVLPYIDQFAIALARASKFVQENEKLVGILVLTVGGLAAAILVVNAAMKVFRATMVVVTAAQAVFNFVMSANPIGLVVIAIAALIGALVFLEKKFGFISGAFKLFSDNFTRYIINPVKTALSFIGDLINAIKSIPGVGAIGGAIGAVGGFLGKIPGLAEGGIVTRPTLAMIGEGGQSEAVIPLDKLGNMGRATNITVNVQGADPQQVVNALERYVRQNGALPGALL